MSSFNQSSAQRRASSRLYQNSQGGGDNHSHEGGGWGGAQCINDFIGIDVPGMETTSWACPSSVTYVHFEMWLVGIRTNPTRRTSSHVNAESRKKKLTRGHDLGNYVVCGVQYCVEYGVV